MKKLRSLFIIMLCFCMTTLVACGKNTNFDDNPSIPDAPSTPTTSTITITEAKEIIVNALAINETTTVSYASNSSAQTSNRDIYEKLGKFKLTYNENEESTNNSTLFNADMSYKNGKINKISSTLTKTADTPNTTPYVSINEDDSTGIVDSPLLYRNITEKLYSTDCNTYYYFNQTANTKKKITQIDFDNLSYSIIYLSSFQTIFTDSAFESLFNVSVTKTQTTNGYSLTLTTSLKNFLIYNDEMTEDDYNSWYAIDSNKNIADSFTSSYIINFENDNIVSVTISMSCYDLEEPTSMHKINSTTTLTKLTDEITAPDWFNLADYS